MQAIERSGFLRLLGGAGVAAVGFLYPGAARALTGDARQGTINADDVVDVDELAASIVGGEVVAKTESGVVLRSHEEDVRALRLSNDTVVWKEFDVDPSSIEIGDWVDAKGIPQEDGSLLAQDGWVFVNIGRRDGEIVDVGSDEMAIVTTRGADEMIELSPALEVLVGEDAVMAAEGVAALMPGTQFGAVGLVLPNGGFRATRIWTA